MSSADPNLLVGFLNQNRRAMYSIEGIGEIGDPCGSPHRIAVSGPVSLSVRIQIDGSAERTSIYTLTLTRLSSSQGASAQSLLTSLSSVSKEQVPVGGMLVAPPQEAAGR
jgi:hypothetical protein